MTASAATDEGTRGEGPPAEPAWSDPATARGWRRSWRIGWALAVTAVVLMTGFMIYIDGLYGHADDLLRDGAHTTGMVLADPPETVRCHQVPVPVGFTIAPGEHVTETYYVDGCGGGGLHRGQDVWVSYDPEDPSDFIIGNDPNEEPGPTLAACVALVGSVFAGVAALVQLPRLVRLRRLLRSRPWTERAVAVAPFRPPWVRGYRAVRLLPDDPRDPGEQPIDLLGSSGVPPDPATLRIAGPRGRWCAIDRANGRPMLVRTPRWPGTRKRLRRSLPVHPGSAPEP